MRLGSRLGVLPATLVTLLIGLTVTVVCGAGFVQLVENYYDQDGAVGVDRPVLALVAAHRSGSLTAATGVLTDVVGPLPLAGAALVVAVGVAWWARTGMPLAVAVVGGGGIAGLVVGIKAVVARPRPAAALAVIPESGFSFPSAHTTGVTALGLLLAWTLTQWRIGGRTTRLISWAAILVVIVLGGLARVYLGVHHPSDVLAGWCLGAMWAATVAMAATIVLFRRQLTHARLAATTPLAATTVAGDGRSPVWPVDRSSTRHGPHPSPTAASPVSFPTAPSRALSRPDSDPRQDPTTPTPTAVHGRSEPGPRATRRNVHGRSGRGAGSR